jgi:hypothetical protein
MDAPEVKRVIITKTKPVFSREQKMGLYLVAGIGGLSFLFGFFYMGGHIVSALGSEFEGDLLLTQEQEQEQEIAKLRASDTDSDGISDYDELYTYKTSPYLADSDGDGVDDLVELQAGNDPNCKTGELCTSLLVNSDEINDSALTEGLIEGTFDLISNTEEQTDIIGPGGDIAESIRGLSATQIRQVLIEGGFNAEELAGFTDEQIIEIYAEIIGEFESSGQLDEIIDQSQQDAQNAQSISAPEMRQVLIEGGFDPAELDALTDEQITSLYNQILADLAASEQ